MAIFFDFRRLQLPPSWIFKFSNFYAQEGQTASPCQFSSKSVKPRSTYGDFSIFQMAAAAILDLKNFTFLAVGEMKRVALHYHAKFCLNQSNYGQDMAIFQDGSRCHLRFSNFVDFDGQNAQDCQTASPCQILSKSVKPRPRYGDFSIFQYGGRHHLGF